MIYFYPVFIPAGQALGFSFAAITVCANAVASVLGRAINRQQTIPPLIVTIVSMGFGSFILLGIGLVFQGLPPIDPVGWIIVVWLAVVNTALAFTLWNKTLRILSAVESSIINSTMLIQIAVLAWLFLGERLVLSEVVGLLLVVISVIIVQIARS